MNLKKKIYNLLKILEDRFKPEINNCKSIFRLKLIDNENYEYSKEATEKIFLYTFKKVKLNEEYNHEKIIKETMQNSNKVKYFIFEDKIVVCCSHLFFDGSAMFNLTSKMFDYPEEVKQKNFIYIPIYNEIKLIQTIPLTFKYLNKKSNLSYDYSWKKYKKTKSFIKFNINIKLLKKLKNKINNNLLKNDKISFPIILASLQTMIIFNSTKKDKLNIGITVAFSNKCRFNNFSALPVIINRPKNWNNINIKNFMILFYEIIFKLNEKVNKFKNILSLIYSITNIYNFKFGLNKNIDVLISSIPMCTKNKLSINNVNLKNTIGFLHGHTMPIYIMNLSQLGHVNSMIHIRTDDVDINKIKYFTDNINKWLNSKIDIKNFASHFK